MRVLIAGFGKLGTALAEYTEAECLAVSRSPIEPSLNVEAHVGDLADPAFVEALPWAGIDAVVCTATPGLRRPRAGTTGNNLPQIAENIVAHAGERSVIYTASTAVYASAEGLAVNEGGTLASGPRPEGLLTIEGIFAKAPRHYILRCPAIIGPQRCQRSCGYLKDDPAQVPGNPDRAFPFIDERDLVEAISLVLTQPNFPTGVVNVADPTQVSARQYYQHLAGLMQISPSIIGSDKEFPNRHIDSQKFRKVSGKKSWLGLAADLTQ